MSDFIQASGSYNVKISLGAEDYSISIATGKLCVTLEPLNKEDIEHLISCLQCMLEGATGNQ